MLLRTRLGVMMFLEYAIWGAWAPILGLDLTNLKFSGMQIGWIYSALPLACMVSPFIGGQFADRIMPTQYFLGLVHLAGAAFMWWMSSQTMFMPTLYLMLAWSLMFAPTLALTNSICFIHLKNSERSFPVIRTMGTIGWIVAGTFLTMWRLSVDPAAPLPFPAWVPTALLLPAWEGLKHLHAAYPLPGRIDSLVLTAIFSGLLGIFCFILPNTPPAKKAKNPWAILEALKLFGSPKMAFFLVLCMLATTEFQFFYMLSAPYLNAVGVTGAMVPVAKTVSQWCEILVLAVALPIILPRLGVRWSLFIGLVAWPLRYLIFALQKPLWLVIASLGLHGFGFAFYFIVAFMYVDKVVTKDIKASAQGLITFATYGFGMFLGSLFCGWIRDHYTTEVMVNGVATAVTDWKSVFIVPTIITSVAAVAHLLWFREEKPMARWAKG
jgi:nucleoside transporter